MIKNLKKKQGRHSLLVLQIKTNQKKKKNQKNQKKKRKIDNHLKSLHFWHFFKGEKTLPRSKHAQFPEDKQLISNFVFENNIIIPRIRTSIFLCLATPSISK